MASKSQKLSAFEQWMRRHYDQYLDDRRTDGGFCEQWVNNLLKDALGDPEASGVDRATTELIARAGRGLWAQDPPPPQPDLFIVAGVEIEPTYTFFDPVVPGQFRRVSGRWAAVRHVNADALVRRSKANEAVAAADRAMKEAARIMAIAGDPDALLWDLRDRGAPPPSDDWRPAA